MKGNPPDPTQAHLIKQPLENLIKPTHPLCKLANQISLDKIEDHFEDLYHYTGGPAKPVSLMVALLILKRSYNFSEETIIERWIKRTHTFNILVERQYSNGAFLAILGI